MLLYIASCWLSRLIFILVSQSFSSKSTNDQSISNEADVRMVFIVGREVFDSKEAMYRWWPSQINPLSIFSSVNLIPDFIFL